MQVQVYLLAEREPFLGNSSTTEERSFVLLSRRSCRLLPGINWEEGGGWVERAFYARTINARDDYIMPKNKRLCLRKWLRQLQGAARV